MKNNQYKQNTYYKLLDRLQRRNEVKKQIIDILQSTENLAIEDIRKKIGINRNTFNYWINVFEKEKWLHRKPIKCEGKDKQGNPKTLILDKKFIEWQQTLARKNWESYEEKHFNEILVEKIIREIDEQKKPDKQHKKLIEIFKQFNKEGFGSKLIFLLYDDIVKIDFKLSLTERGKKELENINRKKNN